MTISQQQSEESTEKEVWINRNEEIDSTPKTCDERAPYQIDVLEPSFEIINLGEVGMDTEEQGTEEEEKAIETQKDMEEPLKEELILKIGKVVYLTFDDGPHPVSMDILELLNKYDAKATFFLLEPNMRKQPEAVEKWFKMVTRLVYTASPTRSQKCIIHPQVLLMK